MPRYAFGCLLFFLLFISVQIGNEFTAEQKRIYYAIKIEANRNKNTKFNLRRNFVHFRVSQGIENRSRR